MRSAAALALLLVACAAQPGRDSSTLADSRPVKAYLDYDRPLLVPRAELDRYRCPDEHVRMECDGATMMNALCVCRSLPLPRP